MRGRIPWLLLAALLLWPGWAQAQESRTITGQVTAADTRQAIAGVQVSVRGSQTGTLTDARGNFSIIVGRTATALVFTFVGYRTEELPIASITGPVQVVLETQAIGLEGIVVTALGVQREKRSLGYSVQDAERRPGVRGAEAQHRERDEGHGGGRSDHGRGPDGRFVAHRDPRRQLHRGQQPAAVRGGRRADRQLGAAQPGLRRHRLRQRGTGHRPEQHRVDQILKGPNAAALYGSRAQNGAVVITTKSGRGNVGGLGLSATMSLTAETPLRLPKYQNLYGQGFNGSSASWMAPAAASTTTSTRAGVPAWTAV
jgi:TonB-dependent SusC/RagA subfamily outer membrane receptor